jgi:hypothetical protein
MARRSSERKPIRHRISGVQNGKVGSSVAQLLASRASRMDTHALTARMAIQRLPAAGLGIERSAPAATAARSAAQQPWEAEGRRGDVRGDDEASNQLRSVVDKGHT